MLWIYSKAWEITLATVNIPQVMEGHGFLLGKTSETIRNQKGPKCAALMVPRNTVVYLSHGCGNLH